MKVRVDGEYGYLVYQERFPPGTSFDEKSVNRDAQQRVYWEYEAIKDCVKLVNETKTPSVFFKRHDEMIWRMEWMASMEKYYKFKPPLPSSQLSIVKGQKVATINDFIDRYWSVTQSKIAGLKTEAAKQRTQDSFFEIMSGYYSNMKPENLQKIEALKREIEGTSPAKQKGE